MKLILATKLVSAILAVVIGTTAVGGGAVWAASDSLPGDFIYPVKLTVENLRMDLARTPGAQVDLALQFAEERTAEIQAMVKTGQPVSEQVTARMEQHFQHALRQAAGAPETEMPGLLAQIAQRAQTQAQVLEQVRVRAMAPDEAQAGLKRAQEICQREHEAAMAALGDPQTFRSRYQQREGMPDEVEPPTPPAIVPPGGQEGQQGTGRPDQTPVATPQDDQERDQQRDQDREQQQDQQREQQQDQQREQQQQDQQREQQQDQQREQPEQQQDQQREQQQEQQHEQQQDQQREQEQDQQREQQQEQQQEEQQQEQQREQSSTSDSGGGSGGESGSGSGGGGDGGKQGK